jgi:hypothetical protein
MTPVSATVGCEAGSVMIPVSRYGVSVSGDLRGGSTGSAMSVCCDLFGEAGITAGVWFNLEGSIGGEVADSRAGMSRGADILVDDRYH